jgi:hypothetical protein
MYRPDFDVLPPQVEANWPIIADRFKGAGLKIGVATRPRDMAVKLDWRSDQTIPINPDDPAHREMLWRRFDRMIKHGCTLFYLDSFGDSFEDVKLMRFLREKLGPNMLTFCEHQCDAIMPFSGGYSETTFTAAAGDQPAHYRLWSGGRNWEIYQWLCPGAQMSARLYEIHGKIPPDLSSDAWYYGRQITPLIPFDQFPKRLGDAKVQQEKYLKADGNWKD